MIPRVIDAKYVDNYTLHIRFSDGSEGEVDFEQEADFAPEFLYEKMKVFA